MRNGWIAAALATAVLLAAGAHASAEGWSLTNPFSSGKQSAKATKSKSASNVSRTAMLDGRPVVKPTSSLKRKEPSALEKLGSGTKRFFNKTADALTFKKPAPKKKPSTSYSWGSSQKSSQATIKKKDESWFSSWFTPKEEPQRPQTVNQWLAQKRPD